MEQPVDTAKEAREAARKKWVAMLQITEANGCSENEAMTAARHARKMADEWMFDLNDAKIDTTLKSEKTERHEWNTGYVSEQHMHKVVVAISRFTDTKVWFDRDFSRNIVYKFYGFIDDMLIAKFMYETINRSMIFEFGTYTRSDEHRAMPRRAQAQARKEFDFAMATRVANRIFKMLEERRSQFKSTGRDLVVVKREVVESRFKEEIGIILEVAKQKRQAIRHPEALTAGFAAGDRIPIMDKHPVSESAPALKLK